MIFGIFLFSTMLIIIVLLATGVIGTHNICDYDAPLNLFLFQEPKTEYNQQLVNLWIDKPWSAEGSRIPCLYEQGYQQQEVKTKDRTLVIYSHGNNENLLHCMQFLREVTTSLQVDAVCWDYSGYGLNEANKFERSANGINLSLQTIVEHMTLQLGYQVENIIFWGYSLGSGCSTYMAAQLSNKGTPPAGLVLFGAYASILDVVKDNTHAKVANWFSERWNNTLTIEKVKCPVILVHGQSDGFIKASHSEKLKKHCPQSKLVLLPNTGHTQFKWGEAIGEVRTWLNEHHRQ